MEILIGLGAIAISLTLSALSIKLAAGWFDAEHTSWGRAFGALLLGYVAAVVLGIVAAAVAVMLPAIGSVVATFVVMIAPVPIYAWILGTGFIRALGIYILSVVVSALIFLGAIAILAFALGLGAAGISGMLDGFKVMDMFSPQSDDSATLEHLSSGRALVDAGAALDRVEVRVDQLCACTDESCVDTTFEVLWEDLSAATESDAIVAGQPDETARLDLLLARIDDCQAVVSEGAVAATDGDALDRVEVRVEQLCACTDESCVDTTFEVLWEELSEATESDAIVAGQPDETARLDLLLARIDDCQAAVSAGAIAAAESDGDDVSQDTAAESLSTPQPQTDVSKAVPGEAADEVIAAVEQVVVAPPMPTPAVTSRATSTPAATTPAKVGGALKRYYVLRAIELSAADQHLKKLVRLTLTDGRRLHDQLVGVQNGSLVLKRDKAAGGTRYAIKLEQIERLEVFGL